MSWLLSYSGKELHNIFSFLPILYHYIPFISRITIHLSHVSSTNGVTLKMLDLICPKEQPCDNVPATRPTVKSATTQPSTKEAQPTP